MTIFVATAGTIWWAISLFGLAGTTVLALAQPRIRLRRIAPMANLPASIIIPVKHLEPEFDAAQVSVLTQAGAENEVLIASAESESPALEAARAVLARFPRVKSRVVIGDAHVAVSPKLNNLIAPIEQAAHDTIFVKDANIFLEDGQFATLIRHLVPGVGLVTVTTRAEAAENFPARVEAAFMNGYQARLVLAASALGMGFGLGKILLFSRAAFQRAGGVPAIAHAVAEDNAMTKAFSHIGLTTVIAGSVVRQTLGKRRLATVWQRQLRWMICRRFDEPFAFLIEPFFAALCTSLVALAAAPAFGVAPVVLAAATLGVWYAVENLFLALKGWPPISPLAWLTREMLVPLLWARAWTTREVIWAGQRLNVRRGSPDLPKGRK
jgi:ceramide glucosyltransferase